MDKRERSTEFNTDKLLKTGKSQYYLFVPGLRIISMFAQKIQNKRSIASPNV